VSFRLLLRSAAKADLRETFDWYEERQTGLGEEFMQAVEHKLMQIESNPLQFPAVRGATRRALVMGFPYGIFYVPQVDLISVLAVMHHARAPLRWQRRD
jgi:plasmid stabilization system protein ParE